MIHLLLIAVYGSPYAGPKEPDRHDVTASGLGLCHWVRSELDGPSATWLCLPTGVELHNQPAVKMYLRKHSEWEHDSKSIVRHLSPMLRDSLVVTAGLYFGDWLPVLSRAVGSAGHVYGFEPVGRNMLLANATLTRNGFTNVRAVRACVSNTSAPLEMCTVGKQGKPRAGGAAIYSSMPNGKRGKLRGKQCGGVEVVPCHRLDDVLPWASQRVGLLHLDVERHESEVVDGARAVISKWTPILASEGLLLQVRRGQGEQAGQETPSTRGRWLYELGYRQRCFCDDMHWYTTRAWSATECLRLPACCKSCHHA
jgi:FkbM family methyltransferase